MNRTATLASGLGSNYTSARDVLIADIDGDGWDDVVVANTFGQLPTHHHNRGNDSSGNWLGLSDWGSIIFGAIQLPVAEMSFCAVAAGDINGDGYLDLYFTNYGGNPSKDILLFNNGFGGFTDVSEARLGAGANSLRNSGFGTAVEFRDMDKDGDLDIVKVSTCNEVLPWNEDGGASRDGVGVFILFNQNGFFTKWQRASAVAVNFQLLFRNFQDYASRDACLTSKKVYSTHAM